MDIPSKNDGIGRALTTVGHAAIVAIPVLLVGILFTSNNRYISVPWEQHPAQPSSRSGTARLQPVGTEAVGDELSRLRAGVVALRHRGIQPALSA